MVVGVTSFQEAAAITKASSRDILKSVTPIATLQESEEQGVGAFADQPQALPPQPPSVRISSIEPQQSNHLKIKQGKFVKEMI
ncbi:hypothetical protein PoB_000489600 [Plakobranchus ocellatus]|uniref:Uncharacterized protein n=1 Tax=Plakobranchus ocellatus TaxID=259542 RepID=A0AAV3Y5B9_9GAST|nr:hypothetical protein PoB_000489600 [Plakobranchus ocellatus]